MTATTLSHLPLQAGSALATGAGRLLRWAVSYYSRAPLANTSILALTVFTAMAGSNALYLQDGRHPAPMFGPAGQIEALPTPVTPATRKTASSVPSVEDQAASGSLPEPIIVVEQPRPIGNTAVIALQRKLTTLGLYDGKVDGVYGPKTAGAIKRFEERAGLPPKGELSQDVLDAVARAPIALPQAERGELPRPLAVEPIVVAPTAQTPVVVQPLTQPVPVATAEITGSIPPANIGVPNPAAPEDSFQPLPTPEPLQLSLESATQPAPLVVPRRDLPDSPREALGLVVATAKDGIRALASVIENGPQLGPTPSATIAVAPIPATQAVQPSVAAEPVAVATAAEQPMPPLATAPPPAELTAIAEPALPAETAPTATASIAVAEVAPVVEMPAATPEPNTQRELVAKVQRGLTSLGFLRGEIDGVAGEATAKAIRNFEVYYNFEVTGRVTPGLVDLLVTAGAQI